MLFSLHCFTSSSESFSIPFVGGSGPPRSQIQSSQSIGNKGQLQRTAETKDNGSKGIRKWTDSCGGALHARVCDFHFKMGTCVLSNRRPTQQTRLLVCAGVQADAARPGEEKRRGPLGSAERKSLIWISQPISKQVQIAWMSRGGGGRNAHQGKLLLSVYLARALGCCVEAPQDRDRP